MILWTYQGAGFEIDQHQLDLSRSERYLPEQRPRYEAVQNKLGTNQVLWCYTVKPDEKPAPSAKP